MTVRNIRTNSSVCKPSAECTAEYGILTAEWRQPYSQTKAESKVWQVVVLIGVDEVVGLAANQR